MRIRTMGITAGLLSAIAAAGVIFLHPTRIIRPRGVGRSRRITSSSTTTRLAEADTMRPGNNRNSFRKRFARASDHCANNGLQPCWPEPAERRNSSEPSSIALIRGSGSMSADEQRADDAL